MQTVTLTASARYGYGGKQYIARITGRDSKFTFAREFVGAKSGKRREDAEYMTDEPGLYMTCDIDSKGRKDETYYVVEVEAGGGLKKLTCDKEKAMLVARLLDDGLSYAEAIAKVWPTLSPTEKKLAEIRRHEKKIAISQQANNPSGMVKLTIDVGEWQAGTEVMRSVLVEWRTAEIARLRKEIESPVADSEIDMLALGM